MLSQGDWKRLEDLFHLACEKPPEQREAFAREQAWDHLELLDELLAMLAMESSATAAVREPLGEIGRALESPTLPGLESGARLGPWQVDRLIGSGGMGQVYLGHRADGAYEREVAIKTIGAHGLSARHRAYFEFERQALAQMQHPAIAQIIDAGSGAEDQLYLVMEYVEGQPLMAWCESHRLSLRERVQLFIRICEGVQHAHQKGVIHRDLKPGNVLVGEVDGKPAPKIIDFGIAVETSGNHAGQVSAGGTPGYMSPEQAQPGMDVDSRSDVYSLGGMLFELICGKRPRKAESENSTISDPMRPSQQIRTLPPEEMQALAAHRSIPSHLLLRTVHDDLDWIVTHAMQHEREARYGSVSALIDDLQRWLNGYLPRAVPYRRWLALRKFIARNKVGVAAASLALTAILGGLIATTWALHQANQAAERARVTSDFLASLLASVNPDVARDLDKTLLRKVLDEASTRAHTELANQPEALIHVQFIMADSYSGLGDNQRSVEHLESALTTAELEYGRHSAIALETMWRLGLAYSQRGNDPNAEAILREALPYAEKLGKAHPLLAPSIKARLSLALGSQGKAEEALELARQAWESLSDLASPTNDQRIDATIFYATALADLGRYDEAIGIANEAIGYLTESIGADHPRTLSMRNSLAVYYLQKRDYAGGERELKALLEPTARQYGPDNKFTLMLHANLGGALRQQGTPEKIAEAGPHYTLAMEGFAANLGPESTLAIHARSNHANWLLDNGQAQEAFDEQTASLELAQRVMGYKNPVIAEIQRALAEAALALGRLPEARTNAEQSLALNREIYGDAPGPLARVKETLGKIEAAEAVTSP